MRNEKFGDIFDPARPEMLGIVRPYTSRERRRLVLGFIGTSAGLLATAGVLLTILASR